MAEHELKSWPKYFDAIMDGTKRFELRKCDRLFLVGDMLRLRRWDPDTECYTGEEIRARVTHLSTRSSAIGGLDPEFCVMSIEPERQPLSNEGWHALSEQRDEHGNLTTLALAVDAIEDAGCDCGADDPGTCLACVCEAALKELWEKAR